MAVVNSLTDFIFELTEIQNSQLKFRSSNNHYWAILSSPGNRESQFPIQVSDFFMHKEGKLLLNYGSYK